MGRIIKCDICGFETHTEYWDNGFIAHENATSDHNLRVMYDRGKEAFLEIDKKLNEQSKEYVIKHRKIWLKENHPEMYNAIMGASNAQDKG